MGQKTKVDQRVHPRHIGAPDAQQIILLARQALRPDHIGQGGHQRGKGKRALGTEDGHLHLHKGLIPQTQLGRSQPRAIAGDDPFGLKPLPAAGDSRCRARL